MGFFQLFPQFLESSTAVKHVALDLVKTDNYTSCTVYCGCTRMDKYARETLHILKTRHSSAKIILVPLNPVVFRTDHIHYDFIPAGRDCGLSIYFYLVDFLERH